MDLEHHGPGAGGYNYDGKSVLSQLVAHKREHFNPILIGCSVLIIAGVNVLLHVDAVLCKGRGYPRGSSVHAIAFYINNYILFFEFLVKKEENTCKI